MIRAIRRPAGRLYTIECHVEHNVIRDSGSTDDDRRAMLPTIWTILGTFRLS